MRLITVACGDVRSLSNYQKAHTVQCETCLDFSQTVRNVQMQRRRTRCLKKMRVSRLCGRKKRTLYVKPEKRKIVKSRNFDVL